MIDPVANQYTIEQGKALSDAGVSRPRRTGHPGTKDMYTKVAEDLAYWLEDTATKLAAAMAPQGVAPFAAALTNEEKVSFYRDTLFNPDGTPNIQGRTDLLNRLGPQGFRQVYTAVITAYPQLRIPTPPELLPSEEAPNAQHQPIPGQPANPGAGPSPPVPAGVTGGPI
jgi:hypothetical protein